MAHIFLEGTRDRDWADTPGNMRFHYNNIKIAPADFSDQLSRSLVDTKRKLGPILLEIPVIAANMGDVVDEEMAEALWDAGAIAALPQARKPEDIREKIEIFERLCAKGKKAIPTVGVKYDPLKQIKDYQDAGKGQASELEVVCVDVANGGMINVPEIVRRIKGETGLFVIAGNIGTRGQAQTYRKSGVIDVAKIGIGPGEVCETSIVAGVHVPPISATLAASYLSRMERLAESLGLRKHMQIIADGGIKRPGDVSKALVAGADFVMIGSWLGRAKESPAYKKAKGEGKKTVSISGGSSAKIMEEAGIEHTNGHRSPEGITKEMLALELPVKEILKLIQGGIRSAATYVGAKNLDELYEKGKLIALS